MGGGAQRDRIDPAPRITGHETVRKTAQNLLRVQPPIQLAAQVARLLG
jgi:hypothetical protein